MPVLYTDNSLLSCLAKCERQAIVRHRMFRAPIDPNLPMEAGKAVHEALDIHFRGGNLKEALDAFDKAATYEPPPEGERLHPREVRRTLHWWLQTHPFPGEKFPFQILNPEAHIEIGFAVPLVEEYRGYNVVFTGRVDGLVWDPVSRIYYLLEHKTTSRCTQDYLKDYRYASQLSGYTWAVQETLGCRIAGTYLNVIELSSIPNSNRKCATHGTKYHECGLAHPKHQVATVMRSPQQIRDWHAAAVRMAKRWVDITLDVEGIGDPTGAFAWKACQFCGFADWCHSGATGAVLDASTKYDHWRPFDYASESRNMTTT